MILCLEPHMLENSELTDAIQKLNELIPLVQDHRYDDDQKKHYDLIQEAFGFEEHVPTSWAIQSWRGSDMNAAKELHNYLMPGMKQFSIETDPTCLRVQVCWWPDGLSAGVEHQGEGWGHVDCESQAWLIALIKVRISYLEAQREKQAA